MSLYANAVAAERAAKIARDMADHEAGINTLRDENAMLLQQRAECIQVAGRKLGEARIEIAQLRAALHDCVMSLKGYRRELSDGQPCDAEKMAAALLTPNVKSAA